MADRAAGSPRPRILLTGASGTLGRVLAPAMAASGFRPVLSDLAAFPDAVPDCAEFRFADLTDADTLDSACPDDVTAIVHFGGINTETAPGPIVAANVAGTIAVYELARRRGARVVYASSNHVIGFYERGQAVTAADPYRPDGLYGVSKVFAETLGRMYFDKFGVASVQLRIGSCLPAPTEERHLATWLSYPDLCRLVAAAVTVPDPGFAIVWGISANTRRWWSGDDGARIGFAPRDDAEAFAAAVGPEAGDAVALRFQGGPLCSVGPR